MSTKSEMVSDLREIIEDGEDAQIKLVFSGRPILGTKGNLLLNATFDQDGGGVFSNDDLVGTFIADEFPQAPLAEEIVQANGVKLRITRTETDDFGAGIVLHFSSPNQE